MTSDKWYQSSYNEINESARSGSLANRVLHKMLEYGRNDNSGLVILELGGNNGEHIPFVRQGWKKYLLTDIRMPHSDLIENLGKLNVEFEIADAENLPYSSDYFDRVIVTCVFHHLRDPEFAFKEIRRVLKPNGRLDVILPNDPGLIYRLLRRITTVRKAKKLGMDSEVNLIHAREHRNHYLSLIRIFEEVYKYDRCTYFAFPFVFRNYHLNAITRLTVLTSKPAE